MAKYDVIVKHAKTGEERTLGQLTAVDQIDAKKQAVRLYFTEVNMVMEQLMVVRSKSQAKEKK